MEKKAGRERYRHRGTSMSSPGSVSVASINEGLSKDVRAL